MDKIILSYKNMQVWNFIISSRQYKTMQDDNQFEGLNNLQLQKKAFNDLLKKQLKDFIINFVNNYKIEYCNDSKLEISSIKGKYTKSLKSINIEISLNNCERLTTLERNKILDDFKYALESHLYNVNLI